MEFGDKGSDGNGIIPSIVEFQDRFKSGRASFEVTCRKNEVRGEHDRMDASEP